MKLLTLILLSISSIGMANADYKVNTILKHDSVVIGTPILVVASNDTASMSVEGLYSLELSVAPKDAGFVEVNTKITLNNQIAAPSFSTKIGEEVSIAIGEQEFIFVVDDARS
ncbi:hypothetical protein [Alteromonas flava]|uniref:hypothetical protein n=1 Tax=Alteromonas flava TaxID=2048003 RepID=UPI000C2936C4|nr:hypothetical protein [Alteromonas flava]